MRTILVANTKGGCGKTTIATNLAAALAQAGHITMLADVDRQRSALNWAARRPADHPPVDGLDWVKAIGKPPKGAQRLVIDSPAAMRMKQMEELVRLADVVVLPVLPSVFDETATAAFLKRLDTLKPVRKDRTSVAVLGNRMRGRTKAADRLDRFLAGLGQRVVTRLRDSAVYAEAAAAGVGLHDWPARRAAAPRADWAPLLDWVEAEG